MGTEENFATAERRAETEALLQAARDALKAAGIDPQKLAAHLVTAGHLYKSQWGMLIDEYEQPIRPGRMERLEQADTNRRQCEGWADALDPQ